MRTKLFALYAAVALVLAAAGPGIGAVGAQEAGNTPLDVAVNQADDGSVTVEVTQNESGVANASVGVEALDNGTYAGEGEYTTDDEGIVDLPAPEENVTVNVTADVDNRTAYTVEDLTAIDEFAEEGPFGQVVSEFVHSLMQGDVQAIGPQVASFVVENNPGNAPDHAGPPDFLTGEEDGDDERGPPGDDSDDRDTESADDERGPPEHAGPPDDDADAESDDDRGPPEDAGPPEDGDDEDDEEEEEEEEGDEEEEEDEDKEEEEEEEEDDDDNGAGPPDDAGPPE